MTEWGRVDALLNKADFNEMFPWELMLMIAAQQQIAVDFGLPKCLS
jgi:hypothetical protein